MGSSVASFPETEIAWLLKIAHNVCLSTWDSDRRRRHLEVVQSPDRIDAVASAGSASERESVIALETALGALTELQRQAIILREWRGLSYHEIAEELELSQSAVETLIFRARRSVARSLDRQDVERPSTLARCLDFTGFFAALKSALGLGGSAKVATGLVCAAVLAGSIPDVPKQPATEQQAAPAQAAPVAAPSVSIDDPVTSPGTRAAAAKRDPRPAVAEKRQQGKKGQGSKPVGQDTPGPVAPALSQTLDETIRGVTGTLDETVRGVTETVDETLPPILPPVLDLVEGAVGGGSLLP